MNDVKVGGMQEVVVRDGQLSLSLNSHDRQTFGEQADERRSAVCDRRNELRE
jgi:hypothetical protein